jgi:hypothetical protein
MKRFTEATKSFSVRDGYTTHTGHWDHRTLLSNKKGFPIYSCNNLDDCQQYFDKWIKLFSKYDFLYELIQRSQNGKIIYMEINYYLIQERACWSPRDFHEPKRQQEGNILVKKEFCILIVMVVTQIFTHTHCDYVYFCFFILHYKVR